MHGGPVGAHLDGDEVAVPGGELLELREELLALGSPLRAPEALLRLPGRQVEAGELHLLLLARLVSACARVLDERRRRGRRIERVVEVRRASLRDQDVPARGLVRVEQPLEAVEAPGGDPGKGRPALLVELPRARVDPGAHGPLGEPAGRGRLAGRARRRACRRLAARGRGTRARAPRPARPRAAASPQPARRMLERWWRTWAAISSGGSVPSRATTRSGNSSGSRR